ncbi:MAG: glycosyltransferase, partial [Erysipelotrichaceae bacterium]|nr:glycosyltransferase [Erysipelotrichaceae bacterium]
MRIDAHCHLGSYQFDKDREETVKNMLEEQVEGAILICCNIEDYQKALVYKKKQPLFKIACGIHPQDLEEDDSVMMIGIVSRLTEQKGMELISRVLPELMASRVQLVVLGTGEYHYENVFRSAANAYAGRLSANFTYSEELSHRIYAASDAFLMPSRFEPCGLSQLIALRYGSLPIVRETGGLKDT